MLFIILEDVPYHASDLFCMKPLAALAKEHVARKITRAAPCRQKNACYVPLVVLDCVLDELIGVASDTPGAYEHLEALLVIDVDGRIDGRRFFIMPVADEDVLWNNVDCGISSVCARLVFPFG